MAFKNNTRRVKNTHLFFKRNPAAGERNASKFGKLKYLFCSERCGLLQSFYKTSIFFMESECIWRIMIHKEMQMLHEMKICIFPAEVPTWRGLISKASFYH